MIGWIKIHRQLTEHWIWEKPEYLKWWLDILMQANIQEKKVIIKNQVFKVERGEVIYSYETWANRWKINKSKVVRFLKLLEKDSMIVLKNETVTTRITICKYETYQGERNDNETEVKRNRNASETQVIPTKESKEYKNDKEEGNAESHNEIFKKLWANRMWLESLAMLWKKEISEIREHLNRFRLECISKEDFKTSEKYAKEHFVNWTKYNPIPEPQGYVYKRPDLSSLERNPF
jgi:hypothetical protein